MAKTEQEFRDDIVRTCRLMYEKGWVAAKWEPAAKDQKREFKYYRLTPAGRKQLVAEESKWKQLTGAIARVMWPAEE